MTSRKGTFFGLAAVPMGLPLMPWDVPCMRLEPDRGCILVVVVLLLVLLLLGVNVPMVVGSHVQAPKRNKGTYLPQRGKKKKKHGRIMTVVTVR